MVFYYQIRGGQCLNQHSHITLAPSDIVCYVGRDKVSHTARTDGVSLLRGCIVHRCIERHL